MAAWPITPDDVAAYLDVPYPPDDRLDLSTAAVVAAVEGRRSDLKVDGAMDTVPGDVHAGSIMWAAQLYQSRNAPSGYAGYGDETTLYDALGARRAEIMRLIGWRRPVAR
jgi:hypothetical protein